MNIIIYGLVCYLVGAKLLSEFLCLLGVLIIRELKFFIYVHGVLYS